MQPTYSRCLSTMFALCRKARATGDPRWKAAADAIGRYLAGRVQS